MFIGSEGGFEEAEAQLVLSNGATAATLGKRILRAETAPLAALSVIMYQTDNFG
jgi:16S rRNA (uracil1498-N3)-methyltransferase